MLFLVFSLFMFVWQAKVAIDKLVNPPVVDSTERLNMTDIEPLLITICPHGQWSYTKLKEFGYEDNFNLFMGLMKIKMKIVENSILLSPCCYSLNTSSLTFFLSTSLHATD